MQIAFYRKYEVSDDQTIHIDLVKNDIGNRVISVLYITGKNLNGIKVDGYTDNAEDPAELTGVNIATFVVGDEGYEDNSPILYVVEPYSSVNITFDAGSDASAIVKGVY